MEGHIKGMNKQQAGQLGGLQTYLRYGSEGMSERGSKGGRPRLVTISDIRQQSAPEINKQRRVASNGNLAILKELWRENGEELLAVNSSSQGGRVA